MNTTDLFRKRQTALFAAAIAVALPGVAMAQMGDDNAESDGGTIVITGDQTEQQTDAYSDDLGADSANQTPAEAEAQQRQRTADRQAREMEGDAQQQRRQGDQANQRRQDRQGQLAAEANGQQNRQRQQAGAEKQELSQQKLDEWFKDAAAGHQFEIEAAKVAQQQSQDQQVQQLARTIEQDHTSALKNLREQAQKANVQVSETPDLGPVKSAMLDELKAKQGEEFTRAYVFGQDAGHRADILKYNWAKEHVSNEPVQAYVTATLPVLEKHHQAVHGDAGQLASLTGDRNQMEQGGEARLARGGDVNARQQGQGSDYRMSQDPNQRYFEQRLQSLNYERQLGERAGQQARNEQVRAYGEQRVQQAEQQIRETEQSAQQAGYEVSADDVGTSRSQQARLNEMGQLDGDSFDREYVFEQTGQNVSRSFQDRYAAGQNGPQQESANRNLQSNAQEQQELQRLLILVVEPQQGQMNQQGQPGQQDRMGNSNDQGTSGVQRTAGDNRNGVQARTPGQPRQEQRQATGDTAENRAGENVQRDN